MATFEQGPVSLRYEVRGDGPPILMLAPGGLRASRIETWANVPWNPVDALADRYRVIAMDQRNTGTSVGPISADDGWDTYAADQLALMDHLGIERFGVVGMCIGGAFVVKLAHTAPARVTAAVAMQPIGLDDNREAFRADLRRLARRHRRRASRNGRRRLGARVEQPLRWRRPVVQRARRTDLRRHDPDPRAAGQ